MNDGPVSRKTFEAQLKKAFMMGAKVVMADQRIIMLHAHQELLEEAFEKFRRNELAE